jgi:pyruvate-formate lyase-activating enzyme
LETNGLHPEALERIIEFVDIVSIDIKLPSLCGGGDLLTVYERTLPLLRGVQEAFCKIVIGDGFDAKEYEQAVGLICDIDPGLPLVIQPVTPPGDGEPLEGSTMIDLYRKASARLEKVRIIPQCHRILNVR